MVLGHAFSCDLQASSAQELAAALRTLAAHIQRGEVASGSLNGPGIQGQYVHLDTTKEQELEKAQRALFHAQLPNAIQNVLESKGFRAP